MKKKGADAYITHYDIEGDQMILHYNGLYTDVKIPYTKEYEDVVLKSMTDHAKFMLKHEDEFRTDLKQDLLHFILNTVVFLGYGSIQRPLVEASGSNSKLLGIIGHLAATMFGIASVLYGISSLIAQDKVEDIKKYKYFFENEQLINDEIFKRFVDFYGETSSIDELNTFTINDLYDYNLIDLQEMVESIKSSNKVELQLKKL